MNDIRILENLFNNKHDEITFKNLEESNIISLNNDNKGDYSNNKLLFNTLQISKKMIDYSKAYILFEVKATIPFLNGDDANNNTNVKNSLTLRNSNDIITNLKILLNNIIISDEIDTDKSRLINFILHNSNTNKIDYRNLNKIDDSSDLNINNNKFIITSNYAADNTTNHEITLKFPIFLKDINNFCRKIDIINFGEFNIQMTYKNPFIFKRNTSTFNVVSAYLYVNEIKLSDSDNIKYLKMLNSGYTKKINFLENNVRKFTNIQNGKQNFNLDSIANCNSIYFYGVLNDRIDGNFYKLPSKNFENINCIIGSKRIDEGIPNDINGYMILKDKSTFNDEFLVNYKDFIDNYRIYSFNIDRIIRDDNSNQQINITCESDSNDESTVYVIYKTYATVTLNFSENGIKVYKNY